MVALMDAEKSAHLEVFRTRSGGMKKLVLAVLLSASVVCTQERTPGIFREGHSQVLDLIKAEFQKHNPKIDRVELFDVRPVLLDPVNYPEKPNHYVVVARGVRDDLTYRGNWDDELMGLFLFDDALSSVERTLAFLPTEHWGDFIVKIVKIRKDTVTVQGFDLQRDDTTSFIRRYSLRPGAGGKSAEDSPSERTLNRASAAGTDAVSSLDSSAIAEAIRRYYDAFSRGHADLYRSLLTDDYLLLENGEILDAAGDLRMMPNPDSGYRRTDVFDFRSVRRRNEVAYAVYFLKSEIKDGKGSRNREWLESAVLIRSDAGWHMALLHSTRINK